MKILCNISKYVDGKIENGYSLAYFLFYQTFKELGYTVDIYINNSKNIGIKKMNVNFLEKIEQFNPDIVFSMNISDDFDKKVLLKIKNKKSIKSVCWMSDDQWRFDTLGKKCIGYFDYIITTDPSSYVKYGILGQKSILSEYGIKNKNLLNPSKIYKYNVSFIGGINSWRKFIIDELEKKGIHVECFGSGWKNGRVTFDEMYKIFNSSKINLNLSNSIHYNFRYLISGIINFKKQKKIIDIFRPFVNILLSKKNSEQIKARFFEVAGSGGFLLSYDLKGIENYFIPDKEIALYKGGSIDDISLNINKYLLNDKNRYNISKNGFLKVKNKYTFENILSEIINDIKGE